MKSIANQYRDLKEGRMSQGNFMRNLRMNFPQYVTNVTSFDDAVRILKNKAILTESTSTINEEVEEINEAQIDPNETFGGASVDRGETGSRIEFQVLENTPEYFDIDYVIIPNSRFQSRSASRYNQRTREEGRARIMKDPSAPQKDWIKIKGQSFQIGDNLVKMLYSTEELNEAKNKKAEKTELHPNQIHPQELRMGIKVELEHTDDLDKAKKIALDHLAENPFYYTQLKLSGVDVKALPSKEKKAIAKKKDETELVDKANQMQKVKIPKVVKEGLNEDHAFDRESQIEFIKNSGRFQGNLDNKSDEFIEKLYKSLEDSSNKMSSVDLGGSFDKFKSSLEEVVREVVNEYFDGRDNLIDDIAAEID